MIRASAPGKTPWEERVHVEKPAERVEITVPALHALPLFGGRAGSMRIAGLALGVAGVAGLAVGAGFGGVAASQWSDAKAQARTGCLDPAHYTGCSSAAVAAQQKASTSATISTAGLVGGGVLAGAAVVLWVLAPGVAAKPTERAWITPSLSREAAGLWAGGSF